MSEPTVFVILHYSNWLWGVPSMIQSRRGDQFSVGRVTAAPIFLIANMPGWYQILATITRPISMKLHSSQPCFVQLVLLAYWAPFFLGCVGQERFPSRPITLICPWAAGGGTDRDSRMTAVYLETEPGVPVNVINATGGRGVTGHSHGLHAQPDGYTILMATVELNTMHWSGLTELTHADATPLMSINEDSASLIVRADAPWQTLGELEAEIRGKPKQSQCRSALEQNRH